MNHTSHSRRLWAWGGVAGTLLVAGVGCTSSNALVRSDANHGVIRAQNPEFAPPQTQGQFVSHHGTPVESGLLADGTVVGTPEGYPPGYCPPGMEGHGAYGPMANCNRYPGGIRYTHNYEDPGVPVYPPGTGPALTGPGSPGAVVQYPYYTTKGPDDFFFDEDGRF